MDEKAPLVSVIIPTYNRAGWIKGAIDSVLSQSFRDFELIVVDDGSTDGSHTLLKEYGSRIKYVRRDHGGVSAARNRGIAESRGEYIALLDSDDRWKEEKLRLQVEEVVRRGERVCQTEEVWVRKGKWANPRNIHKKPTGWIFKPSLSLCLVSPSAVMIHKEVLRKVGLFDEEFPACEDYDLWLRISLRYPIHLLDEKLVVKNGGHDDQLSRSVWGLDRFRILSMEKLLAKEELSPRRRGELVAELRKKITIFSKGCEKRGKNEEAEEYRKKLDQLPV